MEENLNFKYEKVEEKEDRTSDLLGKLINFKVIKINYLCRK